MSTLRTIIADTGRILSFRRPGPGIAQQPWAYLVFGLACTWLAGIGRYWDHPRAHLWQYAGLGSLAYVFALAALVWLLLLPICVKRLRYRTVLTFITLTAPPALLYAIPVERVLSFNAATLTNLWFLIIVASWRVVLYTLFLRRVAKLDTVGVVVVMLLPLTAIVSALAMLNLEHVTFNLMSGNDVEPDPNHASYLLVHLLTLLSMLAAPVLLVGYVVLWVLARQEARYRATVLVHRVD